MQFATRIDKICPTAPARQGGRRRFQTEMAGSGWHSAGPGGRLACDVTLTGGPAPREDFLGGGQEYQGQGWPDVGINRSVFRVSVLGRMDQLGQSIERKSSQLSKMFLSAMLMF